MEMLLSAVAVMAGLILLLQVVVMVRRPLDHEDRYRKMWRQIRASTITTASVMLEGGMPPSERLCSRGPISVTIITVVNKAEMQLEPYAGFRV
jgi:hypothetical protein